MCGEHNLFRLSTVDADGSSPHVRGTLLLDPGELGHQRFIPACAGNTAISR